MTKTKSTAAVKRDNPQHTRLISAVITQLGGVSSMSDIANHGIDGGFSGFTYYVDTHKFTMRNRNAIIEMLEQMADELGEDVTKMVDGFGVFNRQGMDADEKKDLYRYLGGAKVEQGTITNVMAWFAAEEVARMFCED